MRQLHRYFLALLALWAGSAHADLLVSASSLQFATPAGEVEEAALLLTNASEAPLEVSAYLRDSHLGMDAAEELLAPGTLARSCAPWITLAAEELRLESGESRLLHLSMRVPEGSRGGFWTTLCLEERVAAAAGERPIPLVRRVTVPVFQEAPGTAFGEAAITGISAAGLESGVPAVRVRIENSGNTVLRCAGRIELRDAGGAVAAKLPLGPRGRFLLLPSGDLELMASPPTPLARGTYTAVAIVDFGGEHLVASEAVLEVPGSGSPRGDR